MRRSINGGMNPPAPSSKARRGPTPLWVVVLSLVILPTAAWAGAFGRPNLIDARAVGSGGAFTGVADDPTAVWFNPAGLAQIRETTLLAGVDVVSPTFNYTPSTCTPNMTTSNNCPQISTGSPLPLPALAFSTRFAGSGGRDPSRLAVGFGMFVTMGGAVDFNETALKAAGEEASQRAGIIHSQVALLELVPSLAYKVNDVLSVGASLRAGVMGMGLTNFENQTVTLPSDANLSGTGAGFGYALGVMVRPLPMLSLGATYRSSLNVSVTGDGSISSGGGATPQQVGFTLAVPWPQSFSVGAAVEAMPRLRIMASMDWTDWSSFQAIEPHFSDPGLDPLGRLLLDYQDNYTVHAGVEYRVAESAVVRAGYSLDTNAIPDRTIDRQLQDGTKHTVGAGAGVRLMDRLWVDAAGELLFGSTRTVPASDMSVPKYLQNGAPGSYSAQVLSFQLTGRYQF